MSTNNPNASAVPGVANPAAAGAADRNQRKVMRGIVTSNKMQKTVVVQVDRKVRHPLYEKFILEAHQALRPR